MPGHLHEGLIECLHREFPGSRRRGWANAVSEAVGPDADVGVPNRIPDLYLVDPERRNVVAFEVEVGSPLNGDRLLEWGRLWGDLDSLDWTLGLVVVDRFGERHVPNLTRLYFAWIATWDRMAA